MISSFMGFKLPKKSLRSTGTCSKCLTPATGARIKMPYLSAPGRSDSDIFESQMCYPLSNSCHLDVKNTVVRMSDVAEPQSWGRLPGVLNWNSISLLSPLTLVSNPGTLQMWLKTGINFFFSNIYHKHSRMGKICFMVYPIKCV